MFITYRHEQLPDASMLSFFQTPRRLPVSTTPYRSTTLPASTAKPHIPLRLPSSAVVSMSGTFSRASRSTLAPVHTFSRAWSKDSLRILSSPSTFLKMSTVELTSTPAGLCPSQDTMHDETLSPLRRSKVNEAAEVEALEDNFAEPLKRLRFWKIVVSHL